MVWPKIELLDGAELVWPPNNPPEEEEEGWLEEKRPPDCCEEAGVEENRPREDVEPPPKIPPPAWEDPPPPKREVEPELLFDPKTLEAEVVLLELLAPPNRPPDPEPAEAENRLAEVTPSMFSLL